MLDDINEYIRETIRDTDNCVGVRIICSEEVKYFIEYNLDDDVEVEFGTVEKIDGYNSEDDENIVIIPIVSYESDADILM